MSKRGASGADPSIERTRKRFARRQWLGRWLRWRPILVTLLVIGLIAFGIYAVWFSPWLRVTGVEVRGTERLTPVEVEQAAKVPMDEPLVRVDLEALEIRVRALADVKTVDVSRMWPNGVRIEVSEREPVAVVRIGPELRGLDAEGAIFGRYKRAPANLPEVRSLVVEDDDGNVVDAMREAAAVAGSLDSGLLAIVDHLEVESRDHIVLRLRDGRQVRWGSAEESAQKAEVLEGLLAEIKAPVYDVSVPTNPTTSQN